MLVIVSISLLQHVPGTNSISSTSVTETAAVTSPLKAAAFFDNSESDSDASSDILQETEVSLPTVCSRSIGIDSHSTLLNCRHYHVSNLH